VLRVTNDPRPFNKTDSAEEQEQAAEMKKYPSNTNDSHSLGRLISQEHDSPMCADHLIDSANLYSSRALCATHPSPDFL
jgi:hypothetical protein